MFILAGNVVACGTPSSMITFDGGGHADFFNQYSLTGTPNQAKLTMDFCNLKNGGAIWFSSNSAAGYFNLTHSIINNTQGVPYLQPYSHSAVPHSQQMVVSNNIWANSLGFTNIGLSCTDLSITNNLFLADTGPIVVSASNYGANLEVHYNSFLSNSGTILSLYSGSNSAFMDATQNYWGRINTTEISSMVLDKNDGITYADFIPYLPILTTPDPSTPKCILASAGDGGSITPSGIITFNFGDNRDFNITPNSGYHIADILVNGTSVGAVSSYLMQNIQGVTTISATFAHDTTPTPSPVYPPLSVPM
jgi:hypothetical protein